MAQHANQPVYAWMRGDLWAYHLATGAARQLTHWGYNGGPILSPDGARLAFLSTSADFAAQWENGSAQQTGGTPPANIWVMDLADETFTLIADQTGASPAGYRRSPPEWSPDGKRMAWLEIDPQRQAIDSASLQLYDFHMNTHAAFPSPIDLGIQGADIILPSLRWGQAGIARLLALAGAGGQPVLYMQIINVDSGETRQFDLGLPADSNSLDFVWVTRLNQSLLALRIEDYWETLDPADGARVRLLDPPRLQSRHANGGIQLIPASLANANGGWDIHWYAAHDASLYHTGYETPRVNGWTMPAISPDGAQMAWHNGDSIGSWRLSLEDGNRAQASDASQRHAFPIPEPVSVVWAPTAWVSTGAVVGAPTAANAQDCALPPLLSPKQQAIVSADVTLKVRGEASLAGSEVGRFEAGAVLTIAAGPVCADGYNWYAVHDDALAGWSAEGGSGEILAAIYHAACAMPAPCHAPDNRHDSQRRLAIARCQYPQRRQAQLIPMSIWAVARPTNPSRSRACPNCGADGLRWYPHASSMTSKAGSPRVKAKEYWIEPSQQTEISLIFSDSPRRSESPQLSEASSWIYSCSSSRT